MNPQKVDEYDYIQFLLAAQRVFSTVEASKVVSGEVGAPAHDAYTRLLQRIPPDSRALWQEVEQLVLKTKGVLVIDDTTLDKPYAEKMAMVSSHWSGKHHAVVMGINLISLLWTDGKAHLPCDFRLYNHSQDGLTKNDHFQNMLQAAQERGFTPELVAFDSWYSSLENLKMIRGFGWHWLTQLKKNRLVSLDKSGNRQVSDWLIPSQGQKNAPEGVWLDQSVQDCSQRRLI